MFGYVVINQEELKVKDYNRYRSFYCGLCRALEKRHGKKGQLTLSYDMTFAAVLLNGLYEMPLVAERHTCWVHPLKKHDMLFNDITDYVADMSILLAYYKLLDNWKDDRDVKSRAAGKALINEVRRIDRTWPRQSRKIRSAIQALSDLEAANEQDLDKVAGPTGEIIAEILTYREDEWSEYLRRMGFYLGKFVYLMDGFEDLEKDRRKGHYNPWFAYCGKKDFDARVENTLTMMMAACAADFEKLPIVQDVDILRNIIYSGVWTKYNSIVAKRNEEADEAEAKAREKTAAKKRRSKDL